MSTISNSNLWYSNGFPIVFRNFIDIATRKSEIFMSFAVVLSDSVYLNLKTLNEVNHKLHYTVEIEVYGRIPNPNLLVILKKM